MEPIALIGEVIFINNKEGFGFLRSENHPKILFLFRDSRLRQSSNAELKGSLEANPKNRYSPALGDWVSFKLKDFETKPGPLNAFEVRFISNPNQEKFMVYIQNHDEFLGELIIKNEKYYLLDSTYKVQIPLQKNIWRLLNDKNLQGLIGTSFPYRILNKAKSFKNMEVELADKFINPEYFDLQEDAKADRIFEGIISGIDKKGVVYFIKISSYKIRGKLMYRDSPGLERGDLVEVKISNVFSTGFHLKVV